MEKEEVKSIKIKRVNKPGYFGINSYPHSVVTIGCEISGKTGEFKTGLSPEDEKFFEAELNLKPGDLNKHSQWWSEVFNVKHALRLFQTKGTELLLDSTMNKLKYKVAISNSKIAPSEINRTPDALFYIDNEEVKAQAEMEQSNYKFEGMKKIISFTPDQKRSGLRLFGKTGIDTMSEAMLNAQLTREMEKDPKKFLETVSDKHAETKGLISELIEKGMLKRKGNYYIHGDDTIAHSTEECVAWLNDPKHDSIKKILETRLSKTKKSKED